MRLLSTTNLPFSCSRLQFRSGLLNSATSLLAGWLPLVPTAPPSWRVPAPAHCPRLSAASLLCDFHPYDCAPGVSTLTIEQVQGPCQDQAVWSNAGATYSQNVSRQRSPHLHLQYYANHSRKPNVKLERDAKTH